MRAAVHNQFKADKAYNNNALGAERLPGHASARSSHSKPITSQLSKLSSSSSLFANDLRGSFVRRASSSQVTAPGTAVLRETLASAREVSGAEIEASPTGPQLYGRYLKLFTAQADALAVAIEAQNLASTSSGSQKHAYESVVTEAREILGALGQAFGVQTPIFSRAVHGEKTWPTRTEVGPLGRRYVNSFKSAVVLTKADKTTYFEKKLAKFKARGGEISKDILVPRDQSAFENQVRYDYCLLEDGTLRSASRAEGSADPGHLILAEGGPSFHDTRVAMAGELMVVRDEVGEVVAALIACNSGHFKPYAEDLPRMIPIMESLGISSDKLVFVGGPNNGSALLPEIATKFDLLQMARIPDLKNSREVLQKKLTEFRQLKPWERP